MFQIGLVLALKALFTFEMGNKTKGFYDFKIKMNGFKRLQDIFLDSTHMSMAQ